VVVRLLNTPPPLAARGFKHRRKIVQKIRDLERFAPLFLFALAVTYKIRRTQAKF
jgi:hypothetical protein